MILLLFNKGGVLGRIAFTVYKKQLICRLSYLRKVTLERFEKGSEALLIDKGNQHSKRCQTTVSTYLEN